MLANYVTYLKFLDAKLTKFFNKQKPYIACKKGCGMCCKNAQFPYSEIEVDFLMQGAMQLDEETRSVIVSNIKKIEENKKNCKKGETFLYDCPFLINDVCSVYNYRGIVCRSFGLMATSENGKIKVPFCCFKGFNYANVIDESGEKISSEKYKALGIEEEPVAFNISYEFLTNSDFERGFNFTFGEKKPLIDWFLTEEDTVENTSGYVTNEQDTNNISVA